MVNRVHCGWCGRLIRDGGLPVSHGCCESCARGLLAHYEQHREREALSTEPGRLWTVSGIVVAVMIYGVVMLVFGGVL